jgi:hypothetical protein
MWVFLLLGVEAMKTYKTNPSLTIATYNIPTWTTPLMLAVVISVLVPNTSLVGHLCGLGVGYVCKLQSSFRSANVLTSDRWHGISLLPCTTREGDAMG